MHDALKKEVTMPNTPGLQAAMARRLGSKNTPPPKGKAKSALAMGTLKDSNPLAGIKGKGGGKR